MAGASPVRRIQSDHALLSGHSYPCQNVADGLGGPGAAPCRANTPRREGSGYGAQAQAILVQLGNDGANASREGVSRFLDGRNA